MPRAARYVACTGRLRARAGGRGGRRRSARRGRRRGGGGHSAGNARCAYCRAQRKDATKDPVGDVIAIDALLVSTDQTTTTQASTLHYTYLYQTTYNYYKISRSHSARPILCTYQISLQIFPTYKRNSSIVLTYLVMDDKLLNRANHFMIK